MLRKGLRYISTIVFVLLNFHLFLIEHSGALPYMTEIIGFNGPIYMTHPTKSIVPILLEELHKQNLQYIGRTNHYSTQIIKDCMKKVTAVELHQSVMVDNELEIKAYYAGHVLGAAMFWIKVGSQTVVYTGDFNMNPDRHLGAACIDKCQPDLLITDSRYGTENPKTKHCRNQDFLQNVHECMSRGGKVLIPVFILGRAQELCILLDAYWGKMNLSYPIYFATESLTDRANSYYKMFAKWTNPKMNTSNANDFELKHIKSFDKSYIDYPEPMVVLATNGMLQNGLSLQIFKKWAHDENNMLILPDICVRGTLGYKIVKGAPQIEFGNKEIIKVKLRVEQMSFDSVADANGIMQLIQNCAPKNVVLVHGRSHENMEILSSKIKNEIKIKSNVIALMCGETCVIETRIKLPTEEDLNLLKNGTNTCKARGLGPTPIKRNTIFTVHVAEENRIIMMNAVEVCKENFSIHQNLTFVSKYKFEDPNSKLKSEENLFMIFKEKLKDWNVRLDESPKVIVESVQMEIVSDETDPSQKIISVSWQNRDEDIAFYILEVLSNLS